MRSPCRMAFPFLLMPFWGLLCFLLFLCLFFTLPFFSLCLFCLCSLSLRTLLPDSDFLWLSEFNFHFLKLIHPLIIHIWILGLGQKKIPSNCAKIKKLCCLPMSPLTSESCILWQSCDSGEITCKRENEPFPINTTPSHLHWDMTETRGLKRLIQHFRCCFRRCTAFGQGNPQHFFLNSASTFLV